MRSWLRRLLIRAAGFSFACSLLPAADYTWAQTRKELKPLHKVLGVYQAKFQIEGAAIALKLVHAADLPENSCGSLTYDPRENLGVIQVLRRDEYVKLPDCLPEKGSLANDQKDTVIHELVHFLLDVRNEEHAVQILTSALKR